MTDQELDTLMRRVLLDSLKLDAESTASGELAFEPTPRYQRQMAEMVKDPLKWERRRARPLWKNVAQKAAVILLVFSLSLGSLMAVSPTVRAAVVRWVTEWYETHVMYRYMGDDISGELSDFMIAYLPTEYKENNSEQISWDGFLQRQYENDDGDIISFTCCYLKDDLAFWVDTYNVTYTPTTVNGFSGVIFAPDDPESSNTTITWIDTVNNIQFTIDAMMSDLDILHIAESVSLVKTEK